MSGAGVWRIRSKSAARNTVVVQDRSAVRNVAALRKSTHIRAKTVSGAVEFSWCAEITSEEKRARHETNGLSSGPKLRLYNELVIEKEKNSQRHNRNLSNCYGTKKPSTILHHMAFLRGAMGWQVVLLITRVAFRKQLERIYSFVAIYTTSYERLLFQSEIGRDQLKRVTLIFTHLSPAVVISHAVVPGVKIQKI